MTMTKLNGPLWAGTSSTTSERWHARLPLPGSVLLCLLAGLAIVLIDTFVRIPLHVPGWRGLVMVPLLIETNRRSGRVWGATAAAIAAAGFGLWLGDPVRFGPLAYLLPGLVADTCLWLVGSGWLTLLAGGLLINLASLATAVVGGAPVMMQGHGPMAWIGHTVFGIAGGFVAAMIARTRHT